jgi:hypothetical protein
LEKEEIQGGDKATVRVYLHKREARLFGLALEQSDKNKQKESKREENVNNGHHKK